MGQKGMQVLRVHELGGPEKLRLETIPSPSPGAGELGLKVLACGVNFADGLLIRGKYQANPDLPFGPGSEVCGVVNAIGANVEGFHKGDRVMALPGGNGYASEVLVPATSAIKVPQAMSDEVAAGFAIAYGTSHIALWHKAGLKEGETLVVHGAAGGVGLTAVEIGAAMGARVIATASSSEKRAIALEHGADLALDSGSTGLRDEIKDLTDGRGADVIYDPVGGALFDISMRSIAFEGRIIVVGFASGTIPQIPANIVMVKNIDVLGLNWPNYKKFAPEVLQRSFKQLFDWFEAGKLSPFVSERFPLEDGARAIEHVWQRKALGKVVIVP